MTQRPLSLTLSAILLPLALAAPAAPQAWATPPGQAPAHGWRKKHDPHYMGYTGHKWEKDYGIVSGRCNREEIGTVLGGVVGGAIGSQIGKGDGRMVATILGAVLGAVIGREIGRDMDEEDRACFGHTLELARVGHPVVWSNPAGVRFSLTPVRAVTLRGLPCREYTLVTSAGSKKETTHGAACLTSQGTWENAGR
jgi:surface antigen